MKHPIFNIQLLNNLFHVNAAKSNKYCNFQWLCNLIFLPRAFLFMFLATNFKEKESLAFL